MGNLVALARRELGVYFVSPMAYVILTVLLLVSGWWFYSDVESYAQNRIPISYTNTLFIIVWLVILVCPLITMRLIAEEKNRGTIELLMTSPVTELQVVLAKYLAAILFLGYLLLPTVGYAILVSRYGDVDWGAVGTGYFGVMLAGACIFAVGIFISSLCNSQVTAGIITLMVAFGLVLMGVFASRVPDGTFWKELYMQFYLIGNIQDLLQGVADSRPLIYCGSLITFFIFLTVRVLESRRWR